ncbi:hypothetical protein [Lactovum odontotermitis]
MTRLFKYVLPAVFLVLLCLVQLAYLLVHASYHLEYLSDWLFFIMCIVILILLTYLLLVYLQPKSWLKIVMLSVSLVLCVLVAAAGFRFSSVSTLSISPDGRHIFILKTKRHQTTYLQNYFWLFGKPVENLPYSTGEIGKTVWLDDDVAAVTYAQAGNAKLHVYIGTYGYRHTTQSDYYVSIMAQGKWTNGKDTLTVENRNFTVNGQKFDSSHAVQFGTSAVVLITDSAKYVVEIPKDFPADPQTGTVVKLLRPNLIKHPSVELLQYSGIAK